MKQLFNFIVHRALSTVNRITARGLNGGRTGVEANVKQPCVTRGFIGSISVVDTTVTLQSLPFFPVHQRVALLPNNGVNQHQATPSHNNAFLKKVAFFLFAMLLSVNMWVS